MPTETVGLAPGVIVEIDGPRTHLRDLKNGHREPMTGLPLELLHAMALGRAPLCELSDQWRRRSERGQWVVPTSPLQDQELSAPLRKMDASFAWFLSHLSAAERVAYEQLLFAHSARRLFRADLGQCPALPETGVRRALLVARNKPARVALLGDDDMVSVALAALGIPTVVFDLDTYLLELLRRIADEQQLPIECVEADFRLDAPDELAGSFDAFFADPMSNEDCIDAFVGFGVQLLSERGRGWVCASAAAEALCWRVVESSGLLVEEHLLGFNHYYWSDFRLTDYTSDLFVLARRGEGTATTRGVAPAPGRFYDEVVHRALAIGRIHFIDLPEARCTPRSLRRFAAMLGPGFERKLFDERWSFTPTGSIYSAHLDGPVALTIIYTKEGSHLEIILTPSDPPLLARIRLISLRYFKVTPRMFHIMRGQGIVSQILEQSDPV